MCARTFSCEKSTALQLQNGGRLPFSGRPIRQSGLFFLKSGKSRSGFSNVPAASCVSFTRIDTNISSPFVRQNAEASSRGSVPIAKRSAETCRFPRCDFTQ